MGFLLVLLTILKIIGIILAAVLGLAILIVLVILIFPIRYRGRLAYADEVKLKIKLTYLLHIITVIYELKDGEFVRTIYLFGREYVKRPKKKKKKRRKHKKRKHNKTVNTEEVLVTAKQESEPVPEPKPVPKPQPKPESKSDKQSSMPDSDDESLFGKAKDLYNDFTGDKEVRDNMIAAVKILWEFIKAIKPKKHIIRINFGTGEPAGTGKLLGIIYAVAAMLWLRVEVTPDFENKLFEAEADFKGNIRILKLIKVYKDDKINDVLERLG